MKNKPMTACPVCKSHNKPLPHCQRCGGAGEIVDIYRLGPELKPGGIYCAPWCGRGCTKKEHDRAHQKAKALAERMGEGWTPHVWENLGWHHRAESPCGRIKVHPPFGRGTHYNAFFGTPNRAGGRWAVGSPDPKEAVRLVIDEARRELEDLGAMLQGLEALQ